MNIHTGNIKTYLTTLTPAQLQKELTRVSSQYQGFQVNALSQDQLDSWNLHITLIEEEIERRG